MPQLWLRGLDSAPRNVERSPRPQRLAQSRPLIELVMKPIKQASQWPTEGGGCTKPIGLPAIDIDTCYGAASFVKLETNGLWLEKAVLGKRIKRALRRSTRFSSLTRKR